MLSQDEQYKLAKFYEDLEHKFKLRKQMRQPKITSTIFTIYLPTISMSRLFSRKLRREIHFKLRFEF